MDPVLQGRDPGLWHVEVPSVIRQFFGGLGKHVIYFAGYGELGYEDEGCAKRIAYRVLAEWLPSKVVVHAGTLLRVGGLSGIAEVYAVARELGIVTTGIHPSVAQEFGQTHHVSPYCDHVFFVHDKTWGGLLPESRLPSPTLQLHLDVSHEVVAIGGGKHAAGELEAFVSRGKRVRFYPADMHHATTRQWSQSTGAGIQDMRGAAHLLWAAMGESTDDSS